MSQTQSPLKLAVIGAGLIGERHARLVAESEHSELDCIVDPDENSEILASSLGAKHSKSFEDWLGKGPDCDGVIIATPNSTHRDLAVACVNQGIPCLIEKPLAATSEDAQAIVEASEENGVQILVGHHRRHHFVSHEMKGVIASGSLGQLVGAQLTWMLRKPAEYFAAGDWRTRKGGGPVWINLIHEIDLLRYFLGEIVEVQAMLSNAIRNTEAEDTGIVSMRTEGGVLVSAILSDTAPSPWHFEGGSGENPNIAATGQDGLRVFGTEASLSFPSMVTWKHAQVDGHWGTAICRKDAERTADMAGDAALKAQLENFLGVIRGEQVPLVAASDGLQNVRVVEAIHRSAQDGRAVKIAPEYSEQETG